MDCIHLSLFYLTRYFLGDMMRKKYCDVKNEGNGVKRCNLFTIIGKLLLRKNH